MSIVADLWSQTANRLRLSVLTLALENDALKTLQAKAQGEVGTFSAAEVAILAEEIKMEMVAPRTSTYFSTAEARWDRQPASGRSELFP